MCVLLITLSTQLNSTIIYCFVDLHQANSVINSSQTIFLAIFIEYIFEISAWIYFIISSEWAFFSCHPITTLHHLERKKKVFNAANFWTQKLFIPSSSTPQTLKKRVKNCIWQKCKLKNKLKSQRPHVEEGSESTHWFFLLLILSSSCSCKIFSWIHAHTTMRFFYILFISALISDFIEQFRFHHYHHPPLP